MPLSFASRRRSSRRRSVSNNSWAPRIVRVSSTAVNVSVGGNDEENFDKSGAACIAERVVVDPIVTGVCLSAREKGWLTGGSCSGCDGK